MIDENRKKALVVISLGAGVQSSTMALMAASGELPKPDCAIFADTRNNRFCGSSIFYPRNYYR